MTLEDRDAPAPPRKPHLKRVPAAHCPREATNCRAARGRVIYVEAVDPDGDGDAHFVLASRETGELRDIETTRSIPYWVAARRRAVCLKLIDNWMGHRARGEP